MWRTSSERRAPHISLVVGSSGLAFATGALLPLGKRQRAVLARVGPLCNVVVVSPPEARVAAQTALIRLGETLWDAAWTLRRRLDCR